MHQRKRTPDLNDRMSLPISILKNPSIVLRVEYEDQAVLFDPDTGAAYGINRTGMHIWSGLDAYHSLEDIRHHLDSVFDRLPEHLDRHIEDFIQELAARSLVTFGGR